MMRLLNYLCTFLLAQRALCAEPIFRHVGDCSSGGEVRLDDAGSPAECQTLCLKHDASCKYFTLAASGSGACYWEESCTSHNDNTAWKGYAVVNVEPVFMHVGDCLGGGEVRLDDAGSPAECQFLCLKHEASCQYFTLAASGSGACYWEKSCTSHNDNTAWKGYRVGDIRCGTDECRNEQTTCPTGKECLALCSGTHACDKATINAATSTSLTVIGTWYYSLQSAVVRCPINGQCNVECKGPLSCRYTKVYYHNLANLKVVCTESNSCTGLQKLSSAAAVPLFPSSLTSPWIMAISSLLAVLLLVNLLMICYKNCGRTPRTYHAVKPIDSEDNEENVLNM